MVQLSCRLSPLLISLFLDDCLEQFNFTYLLFDQKNNPPIFQNLHVLVILNIQGCIVPVHIHPEGVEQLQMQLQIGQLLKTMLDKGNNSLLYTTIEQLNEGSSLMTVDHKTLDLAWLNLRVEQSACRELAFLLASMFLKSGLSFVEGATKRSVSYGFTLMLMTMFSQMDYCKENQEDLQLRINKVFNTARPWTTRNHDLL